MGYQLISGDHYLLVNREEFDHYSSLSSDQQEIYFNYLATTRPTYYSDGS
jgi:hypothetical protein